MNYLSQSELVRRGWTKGQIAKLLGQPDSSSPNPYVQDGAPMRLFDLERVERAEASDAFQRRERPAPDKNLELAKHFIRQTVRAKRQRLGNG